MDDRRKNEVGSSERHSLARFNSQCMSGHVNQYWPDGLAIDHRGLHGGSSGDGQVRVYGTAWFAKELFAADIVALMEFAWSRPPAPGRQFDGS